MNVYDIKSIRNVCVLGHGGTGKTSLTEALAYLGGGTDRLGKVTDGNTVSDYENEEIKRKISVSASVVPLEWKKNKINVLDTPGFFDFAGEVEESVCAADAAIIVVTAKTGVQVGTEKAWQYAEKNKIPKMIFVSKMDEDNADYSKVLTDLREAFGISVAPFYVPILENEKFKGYVNVIKMEGRVFDGEKIVDCPIPDNIKDIVDEQRQMILESVAETSEELMEKFFGGEEFTNEEIHTALRQGVAAREIVPVLCGSAFTSASIRKLLDAVLEYFPSPDEAEPVGAKNAAGDAIEVKCDESAPLCARIFKTIADPFVGKLSFVKVYGGKLTANATLYNANQSIQEKAGKVFCVRGKKQLDVPYIGAGDIGAVPKLSKSSTGDTLCAQGTPIILDPIDFPVPNLGMAIAPKEKGDEEKISTGLARLREEDKTLSVENNTETHETIIRGLGDTHLDVVVSKLKDKFKVDVVLSDPKIAYRETIRKKVKTEGKHKKQSGGHGQFGHVWIEFEPCEEAGPVFEEKIFGGAVPKNYFPAVEKGIKESALHGVLAGYPVVNLKATLVDGSYHPVDSSEMAFKTAASLAFKAGLPQAGPVLLEPVDQLEILVPDSYMGDIMGDINKRRGRVLGMNPVGGGMQQVTAEVPASELVKYATDLRSMTQGRGSYTQSFARYEEAPPNITEKVIEEAKAEKE